MKSATELFGARIRELRKGRGLSQDQLAEVIGIDQKHMSRIELGKSYPSLDRLMRIAEALQVPLPSLFEFMHLESPETQTQTQSIEEMLKGLDDEARGKAYKIIRAILEEVK